MYTYYKYVYWYEGYTSQIYIWDNKRKQIHIYFLEMLLKFS